MFCKQTTVRRSLKVIYNKIRSVDQNESVGIFHIEFNFVARICSVDQ